MVYKSFEPVSFSNAKRLSAATRQPAREYIFFRSDQAITN